MFFSARSNRGFTLIELLVSIAIIGLLLGVSLVSYRSVQKKKQVQFAAIDVRDAVTRAKTYAVSPPKDSNAVLYRFFIFGSGYRISDGTNILEDKTLPNGILISDESDTSNYPIEFKIVDGGRPSRNNNIWPVEITITGSNDSQTITVQKNGQVEVGD